MSEHGGRFSPATAQPRELAQLWTLAARQLRVICGDVRIVALSIVQPLVMLLLFTQIFGRMANPDLFPDGISYTEYLVPALLITTGIGTAQVAGVGFVRDAESGIEQRFRFLPVRPLYVLIARSVGDLARVAIQLMALLLCACFGLGFAPAGGFWGMAAAFLLSVFVCWSLVWVFLALAAWLRSVEVLGSIGFFVLSPLMFASSAFVPLEALPGWVRLIAVVNPLTYAVDASRNLALGWEAGDSIIGALLSGAALSALMCLIALRGFRRPPNETRRPLFRRSRGTPSSAEEKEQAGDRDQADQHPPADPADDRADLVDRSANQRS
ncbi:ABC transporter permease [Streptomyces chlorus]|uniref:Transport permease protein n=1 Tax=Streptomyces chlorus TaxID=887452 RepID=A0ABW1E3Z4_9ACTN